MTTETTIRQTVWAAIRWPFDQTAGFFRNAWNAISVTTPPDIIPPWIVEWIVSTYHWLRSQLPRAVGFGTPQEQITASIVIAVAMVITSLGTLTVLAAFMIIPLSVGVARLIPVVNEWWPFTNRGGS